MRVVDYLEFIRDNHAQKVKVLSSWNENNTENLFPPKWDNIKISCDEVILNDRLWNWAEHMVTGLSLVEK